MINFTPTPRVSADREILQLKKEFGGELGTLSGNGTLKNVLRLPDNVFITSEKVDRKWDVLAGLSGSDIHSVQSPADLYQVKDRLRKLG